MNSSERIVQDREDGLLQERLRQSTWGAPVGGGPKAPVGMGNLAGWATSAALIGAVLGGIVGQGLGGAIIGALVFGGSLWLLSNIAKRSGAYHRDARPVRWLIGGACAGAVLGAILSLLGSDPFWFAVQTWAIFLGALSGGYCWLARGAARRDVDPESIKRYNEERDERDRIARAR